MKKIAHRCGPVKYPEQTVLSAQQALADGAELVELDTCFTGDGLIVICHDPNAERVFGVDKSISDMTGEEFLALRHKKAPAFPSHRFTDFLESGVYPLLIHVKEGGDKLPMLLDTIRKYGYEKKVTLGVMSECDVKTVKEYNPEIPVLGFIPNKDDVEKFALAGADYIRFWEADASEDNFERAFRAGCKVWIMACGTDVGYTKREMPKKWEKMGADGVLVNNINEYDW